MGTGSAPAYEYGYGRPAATTGYDANKTYYQQAAATGQAAATAGYAASYDQAAAAAAAKPATYAATYTQRAATTVQPQAQAVSRHYRAYAGVIGYTHKTKVTS